MICKPHAVGFSGFWSVTQWESVMVKYVPWLSPWWLSDPHREIRGAPCYVNLLYTSHADTRCSIYIYIYIQCMTYILYIQCIYTYILNSSVEPQRLKLLRARKKNWIFFVTDRDGDTQCLRLYTQDYFLVQCVICSHEKFPNDLYTCAFLYVNIMETHWTKHTHNFHRLVNLPWVMPSNLKQNLQKNVPSAKPT